MTEDRRPIPPELGAARERFLALVADLRPELHRYCARLVGSAVDGEDVVQDTLAKAFYALSLTTEEPPLRPWLFRIAHNAAIDWLKRYERRHVETRADFDDDAGAEEPDPDVVRASLSSFLALPVAQRSAVILKDVLGHSLEEAADTMGTTVPAVKAALFRGRSTLRTARPDPQAPVEIDPGARERLHRYASLFNARDWDALAALLSEECRLDLVSKSARRGAGVRDYFGRYAAGPAVRLEVGLVEGRPALLAWLEGAASPSYFILLEWTDGKVGLIRDYRYSSYVSRDASLGVSDP